MSLRGALAGLAHHSMRAYFVAVAAGLTLVVSAFLPWAFIGDVPLGGVPDIAGLWVLGLGLLAIGLATLSILTRKNSRHPLLLTGLVALGILFLAPKLMQRSAAEQAWAHAQAIAIVDGVQASVPPEIYAATGVYIGLVGAALLVLFGLTIVVKQVVHPYAEPEDDDL